MQNRYFKSLRVNKTPLWSAVASASATPLWILGAFEIHEQSKAPSTLRSAGALQKSSASHTLVGGRYQPLVLEPSQLGVLSSIKIKQRQLAVIAVSRKFFRIIAQSLKRE
jgi:hypothetical protein